MYYIVNPSSVLERRYKRINCLHTYVYDTTEQEIFHLCTSKQRNLFLRDKNLKDKKDEKHLKTERDTVLSEPNFPHKKIKIIIVYNITVFYFQMKVVPGNGNASLSECDGGHHRPPVTY